MYLLGMLSHSSPLTAKTLSWWSAAFALKLAALLGKQAKSKPAQHRRSRLGNNNIDSKRVVLLRRLLLVPEPFNISMH